MNKPVIVEVIRTAEKTAIDQALHQAKRNKSKAAKLLGISRSVLYDKLKKSMTKFCKTASISYINDSSSGIILKSKTSCTIFLQHKGVPTWKIK